MSAEYAMLCCLNRKMGFKIGSRVKIIKQSSYKHFDLIGEEGTIRSLGARLGIILDDVRNRNSSYGAFYFKPSELIILNENIKENTMQNNNITNYLNVAKIKFIDNPYDNPNTYLYANFDPELKPGDICVVKTVNHGFGVAKVEEILDQNDIVTGREIVTKIDMDAYNKRLADRAKATELKLKMQERAKQLQDVALYKLMAENDSTMSEMLKEYQSIVGM